VWKHSLSAAQRALVSAARRFCGGALKSADHRRTPKRKREMGSRDGHVVECEAAAPLFIGNAVRTGCRLNRGFDPAAQHFRYAPRLGNTTTRDVRFARVEYFANSPDTAIAEVFGKTFQELARPAFITRMQF
jgi:hypothetical protein